MERAGQKRICGWHSLSWGGARAAYGVPRAAVPLAGMAGALVGGVVGDGRRWSRGLKGQTVGKKGAVLGAKVPKIRSIARQRLARLAVDSVAAIRLALNLLDAPLAIAALLVSSEHLQ